MSPATPERSAAGLLFVLPRGAFHLLPHEEVSDAQWTALRALLAAAGKSARSAPGEPDRRASLPNRQSIAAYSIE